MGNFRIKISKDWQYFLCFFLIALTINYFYFYKGFFKAGFDDIVHFQAYESVIKAFKVWRLPPVINFIGFSANGEAFNGMYPWITSLIFIIPRLTITNVITSLYISFSILSFITMLNCYFLVKKFTKKSYILLFCVILYSFNQYNLINIYNRGALGETLAFAFLPLVFTGIIEIWQRSYKRGTLLLALGMSLVINSHVLTTIICSIYLIIFELARVMKKKINIREVKSIIFAVVMTIFMSLYTLTNIFFLSINNNLTAPWRNILTLNWNSFIRATTNANLNVQTYNYNFGIIVLVIMIYMLVQLAVNKDNREWKKWIKYSWITFLLLFSWIPYKELNLTNSVLGTIQFASRLLNFVVLFLIIGLSIYLNKVEINLNKKFLISVTLIAMLFSVFTEVKYVNSNQSYNLTTSNFEKYVYGSNYAESDYSKKDRNNHNWSIIYKSQVFPSKKNLYEFYNGTQFDVYSSKNSSQFIRFLTYNGIKYDVILNGKRVKPDYGQGLLKLPLNKEINTIKIISKAQIREYITFVISIISMLLIIMLLIFNKTKINENYRL